MWMVNTSVSAGTQTGMSLLLAVNTVLNVLLSGSLRLLIFFFFWYGWTWAQHFRTFGPPLRLHARSRPLLWNLGLEGLDPGARVGQQLKHFLLETDGTKSGREFTLERLTAAGRPPAATHLHCHSEVVPVFNFWHLQLQPHGHLQHKHTSKTDLIWGRKTEKRNF